MATRSEAPPNCRLFILAGKGVDEDVFREAFQKYGQIDDLWVVKDRRTQEDKGVLYVTFAKASAAALALEEMNGKVLEGNPKPIKVVVASSKRDGSVRDPKEDERYLRLFVIIPKSYKENELRNDFEEYGDIDYVQILKDRQSGDPKGFGYVKFHRAYHAALALEQCDRSFKPKFAEPQMSRSERDDDDYQFSRRNTRERSPPGRYPYSSRDADRGRKRGYMEFEEPRRGRSERNDYLSDDGRSRYSLVSAPNPVSSVSAYSEGPMDMIQTYNHQGLQRLHVTAPLGITQSYLTKLFNLIPGLEYCDLNEQTGIAYVRYTTPQCASYAREKLDMFEYPIGSKLLVRFSENPGSPDIRGPSSMGFQSGSQRMDIGESSVIQQAALVLEKAGINPDTILAPVSDLGGTGTESVTYCNIPLPLPKALMPTESEIAQRLFIVCQPSSVPERILRDAFSRFGCLIDVYLLPGKNYGYAKYASKDPAMQAIKLLHGQNVAGQRLKVLEAEPMRGDDGSNKRQRSDD